MAKAAVAIGAIVALLAAGGGAYLLTHPAGKNPSPVAATSPSAIVPISPSPSAEPTATPSLEPTPTATPTEESTPTPGDGGGGATPTPVYLNEPSLETVTLRAWPIWASGQAAPADYSQNPPAVGIELTAHYNPNATGSEARASDQKGTPAQFVLESQINRTQPYTYAQ
jgi:hypothetical protein